MPLSTGRGGIGQLEDVLGQFSVLALEGRQHGGQALHLVAALERLLDGSADGLHVKAREVPYVQRHQQQDLEARLGALVVKLDAAQRALDNVAPASLAVCESGEVAPLDGDALLKSLAGAEDVDAGGAALCGIRVEAPERLVGASAARGAVDREILEAPACAQTRLGAPEVPQRFLPLLAPREIDGGALAVQGEGVEHHDTPHGVVTLLAARHHFAQDVDAVLHLPRRQRLCRLGGAQEHGDIELLYALLLVG